MEESYNSYDRDFYDTEFVIVESDDESDSE